MTVYKKICNLLFLENSEIGRKVGSVNLTPKPTSVIDNELQKKLDELSEKYKIYLDVKSRGYENYIELEYIMALKTAPKGTGSSYMKELCNIADKNNKIIVLTTAKKGYGGIDNYKKTTSTDRLKNFYSKFGFVSNYSKRDYRPDLNGNMHRYPKTKII